MSSPFPTLSSAGASRRSPGCGYRHSPCPAVQTPTHPQENTPPTSRYAPGSVAASRRALRKGSKRRRRWRVHGAVHHLYRFYCCRPNGGSDDQRHERNVMPRAAMAGCQQLRKSTVRNWYGRVCVSSQELAGIDTADALPYVMGSTRLSIGLKKTGVSRPQDGS